MISMHNRLIVTPEATRHIIIRSWIPHNDCIRPPNYFMAKRKRLTKQTVCKVRVNKPQWFINEKRCHAGIHMPTSARDPKRAHDACSHSSIGITLPKSRASQVGCCRLFRRWQESSAWNWDRDWTWYWYWSGGWIWGVEFIVVDLAGFYSPPRQGVLARATYICFEIKKNNPHK